MAATKAKKSSGKSPTPLTGEQRAEMMTLVKQAKSVEVKVTIPEEAYRTTARALGLDPLDAQIRQVTFFDTPDLALNKAGVVVRARRGQGDPDDTVVKLRPVVPKDLPPKLMAMSNFGVEVDAMPGGFVCSASFKAELSKNHVRAAMLGERKISKLFSPGQREFYETHAPKGIGLDDLSVLGPLNVFKLKFVPEDFGRRLVVELWLYPDGARVLELSTKALPSEAFQVAAEAQVYLTDRGIDLTGEQSTKTAMALKFFADELGK
jgi:lipopolysaccharide export system protein LptC